MYLPPTYNITYYVTCPRNLHKRGVPPGAAIHVLAGPSVIISIIRYLHHEARGYRLRIFVSFEFLVKLVRHERLVRGETVL